MCEANFHEGEESKECRLTTMFLCTFEVLITNSRSNLCIYYFLQGNKHNVTRKKMMKSMTLIHIFLQSHVYLHLKKHLQTAYLLPFPDLTNVLEVYIIISFTHVLVRYMHTVLSCLRKLQAKAHWL